MQYKKPKVPREMKEIAKEQTDLLIEAGQLSFSIADQRRRVRRINDRLRAIHNEGMARQQLDESKPKPPETPQDDSSKDQASTAT